MFLLTDVERIVTLPRLYGIVVLLLAILGVATLSGGVSKKTAMLVLMSWFIPGAGHVVRRDKVRGVVFFVVINFFLLMGIAITKNNSIDMLNHEYYAMLQIFHGLGFFVGALFGGTYSASLHPVTEYELGMLYVIVASMLNLLTLMHLISHREEPAPEAHGTVG